MRRAAVVILDVLLRHVLLSHNWVLDSKLWAWADLKGRRCLAVVNLVAALAEDFALVAV